MSFTFGWPQLVYLAAVILGLTNHIIKHGQSRESKYNAFEYLASAAISFFFLYWGGFFSPPQILP